MSNQYLIWKHAPGYINIQVNQYGQVRDAGTHELSSMFMSGEYLAINCKAVNYTRKFPVHVHRLVMAAFKGERPEGYHIDHKDGDKLNNQVTNLHYVTRSQNQRNRKDQIIVTYNGEDTVLIEALEDLFGKDCVTAKKYHHGHALYCRISDGVKRKGLTFDQAIQNEIKKRGWPVPASEGV